MLFHNHFIFGLSAPVYPQRVAGAVGEVVQAVVGEIGDCSGVGRWWDNAMRNQFTGLPLHIWVVDDMPGHLRSNARDINLVVRGKLHEKES